VYLAPPPPSAISVQLSITAFIFSNILTRAPRSIYFIFQPIVSTFMAVPSSRSILEVGGGRMLREPRNVSSILASFEHMRATTGAITLASWGAAAPEVMRSAAPSDCSLVETVTFIDVATAAAPMTISIPAPTAARTGVDNPTGMFKLFVMTTDPNPFTATITPTVPGITQSVILGAQYQTALYICTGTAWQLVATTGTPAGAIGETLAATLRSGNDTYDLTSPAGFSILGLNYGLDLETHINICPGIFSVETLDAAPGTDFRIIADGSTTGPGGDVYVAAGQTDTGTGGDAFLQGGSVVTTGDGGSANVVGGNGGLPNGSGGRVHIIDGIPNGSGTGGGVLIESASNADLGSAGAVEILAGTGGSAGNAGSVFIQAGASTSAFEGGRIQLLPGLATTNGVKPGDVVMIPQTDGAATLTSCFGMHATGASTATHFVAQQVTAPTIAGGAAPTVGAGSSDTAGVLGGIDANTNVTVTYHKAYPAGSRPFVVLTPGVATTTPVWIVSISNTGFVLRTAEVGGLSAVYYHVIGSSF
jgi:hypothetical protein